MPTFPHVCHSTCTVELCDPENHSKENIMTGKRRATTKAGTIELLPLQNRPLDASSIRAA